MITELKEHPNGLMIWSDYADTDNMIVSSSINYVTITQYKDAISFRKDQIDELIKALKKLKEYK